MKNERMATELKLHFTYKKEDFSGHGLTSGRYTGEGGSFRQPMYVGFRKPAEHRGQSDKAEVGVEDEKKRPTEFGGCREARFSYLSLYWELTSLGTTSWVVIQIELTS